MTTSVSQYRFYCNTEAANVTVWSQTSPTVCPNNNTHSVDLTGLVVLQTVTGSTSTKTVNNYKIYCETEATYVYGWSPTTPTTCYNDNAHTVNLGSVQMIDGISQNAIRIVEDEVSVARNISNDAISLVVPSNSTGTATYTFKFLTSFYSYRFGLSDLHTGDELTIAINPNITLGLIGADITSGATSFIGPAPLIAAGSVGYTITLTDGTNTDYMGVIRSINKATGVVVMDIPTTHSFLAANTLVKMTYYVMKSAPLVGHGVFTFGEDIIGGNPVPVNTVVVVTYKNNTTDVMAPDKRFTMFLTLKF